MCVWNGYLYLFMDRTFHIAVVRDSLEGKKEGDAGSESHLAWFALRRRVRYRCMSSTEDKKRCVSS